MSSAATPAHPDTHTHTLANGHDGQHRASFSLLCLGALGVVFGDIGTSPLYTLKECIQHAGHGVQRESLFGLLSLIFWSLVMVVTVKYLVFIMQADQRGEGGIFALLALVPEGMRRRSVKRAGSGIATLAVVGAALLYGDGTITPAISVLSAIEGLAVARPELSTWVVPITCGILIALFMIQSRGTGIIGKLFGPVMLVWFGTIGALGAWHLMRRPEVLISISPHWAIEYFVQHGFHGALILGSVVLAVTGGEALYADMGHFGPWPIRWVWSLFVMPALLLCYFGQAALLLENPEAASNPFFAMAPSRDWTFALVLLSSVATVIASQALISGAFSLTRQAMLLGFFPRVTIKHTARHTAGQIYIPEINWLLAAGCLFLVLAFRSSSKLAAAYGLAVTGTMGITSILFYVVVRHTWHWSRARAVPLLVVFLLFDVAFFVGNVVKFFDGGYVPVLIGAAFIAAMLVWSRGRNQLIETFSERFPPFAAALPLIEKHCSARVPGTAVFLGSSADRMPPALMRLVERGRALHETIVLLTVSYSDDVPEIDESRRTELQWLGHGFYRAVMRCGFMEHPLVHTGLQRACDAEGVPFDEGEVTYYLGRETIVHTGHGPMGRIAEMLYALLQRNAVAADLHFGIPPRQVIEIGTQIDL